jgi:hypothetical protein
MDRDEVRFLLSAFVLGQLDADQAAAIQRHLSEDESLRRQESFLRWVHPCLLDIKDHLPGDHLTGEELVNTALGQDGTSNQREDWVRSHLAVCEECRELEASIREADSQLKREDSPRKSSRAHWSRWAIAAVLALIVFVSGVWWGNRDEGLDPERQIVAVHLAGVSRGETILVEVTPLANGSLPPLILEQDPWIGRASDDDFTLEIKLLEAFSMTTVRMWQLGATAAWSEDEGGILLDTQTEILSAGRYLIEVSDDARTIIFQTGFHLLPR